MMRLRAAVRPAHDRIERLPFPAAIMAGRLTRADYAAAMTELAAVHRSLEDELSRRGELACVYEAGSMARSDVIRRDLAVLGFPILTESGAAGPLVARFRKWSAGSAESPWPLLGPLYVLEGSRMGSMVIARPLAASMGVAPKAGCGLDYHLDGAVRRPAAWAAFGESMRRAPLTPARADAIVTAAAEAMDGLCDLYASFRVHQLREAI